MTYTALTPDGYTADKFAEDIASVLPFALQELKKSGRMINCAIGSMV